MPIADEILLLLCSDNIHDADRGLAQTAAIVLSECPLDLCVQGAAFVVVLHLWKGFLQPLVIQAAMTVITIADEPLFQIYVLGESATGKLQRPFKKDAGWDSNLSLISFCLMLNVVY